MDATLPISAIEGAPQPTVLGAVLRAVARWIEAGRRLTREEQLLVDAVRLLANDQGRLIIEAENLEDLAFRVESVIEDPAFHRVNAVIVTYMARAPELLEASAEVDTDPDTSVFKRQAALLKRGERLVRETAKAYRRLVDVDSVEVDEAATVYEAKIEARQPLWFVYDWDAPPAVNLLVLEGLRSTACTAAIARAEFEGEELQPWLARGLLQAWCDSLYGFLRLLASMPGSKVSKRVVPPRDRLDLAAEEAATRAAKTRMESAAIDSLITGRAVPLYGTPITDDPAG